MSRSLPLTPRCRGLLLLYSCARSAVLCIGGLFHRTCMWCTLRPLALRLRPLPPAVPVCRPWLLLPTPPRLLVRPSAVAPARPPWPPCPRVSGQLPLASICCAYPLAATSLPTPAAAAIRAQALRGLSPRTGRVFYPARCQQPVSYVAFCISALSPALSLSHTLFSVFIFFHGAR
jgi:hypothetical protein